MGEGGKEKVVQFPKERIKRTPDEVAKLQQMQPLKEPIKWAQSEITELQMQQLDEVAQELLDKFLQGVEDDDLAHVEKIKAKIAARDNLESLAKGVWKVKSRHESGYPTTPVDIALIALYLGKRIEAKSNRP